MKIEQHWRRKGLLTEYREVVKYIGSRQINYLNDLPEFSHNKILCALQHVRRLFPNQKVWLIGSYANGSYRDETTPNSVKEAFIKLYQKEKYSDVDFVVEGVDKHIKLTDYCEIITTSRGSKILIKDKL